MPTSLLSKRITECLDKKNEMFTVRKTFGESQIQICSKESSESEQKKKCLEAALKTHANECFNVLNSSKDCAKP